MFMVTPNTAQAERLHKIFRRIKAIYGTIPVQMEFLGAIDADYLEDFITNVVRITRHPHIHPDLFAFLRLHTAYRENYAFCKQYNTDFLLAKGYTQDQLDAAITDIATVPFDARHQALARHAIRSIFEPETITQTTLDALTEMDWTQKDIFDVVSHTGDLLKNGRILTAYTYKAPQ